MVGQTAKNGMINVRLRVREFGVPPIHDALILHLDIEPELYLEAQV